MPDLELGSLLGDAHSIVAAALHDLCLDFLRGRDEIIDLDLCTSTARKRTRATRYTRTTLAIAVDTHGLAMLKPIFVCRTLVVATSAATFLATLRTAAASGRVERLGDQTRHVTENADEAFATGAIQHVAASRSSDGEVDGCAGRVDIMAAINNDGVNNAEEDADENRRASDQNDPETAEKRSTRAPWRSTVSFWWCLDDFERRRRLGRSLFLRYFVHHLVRRLVILLYSAPG